MGLEFDPRGQVQEPPCYSRRWAGIENLGMLFWEDDPQRFSCDEGVSFFQEKVRLRSRWLDILRLGGWHVFCGGKTVWGNDDYFHRNWTNHYQLDQHFNYRMHQDPSAYLSCFVPMLFFKFVSKRKALPFSESQAIWYSWHKSTRNVDVFLIGNQKHPGSCASLQFVTFSNLIFSCGLFEV